MEIVIHKVNTLEKLQTIPREYGCEIDIRAYGSRLILNHEPFSDGESFECFLEAYHHGLLVLNVKEAGIEDEVLRLVRARRITRFFLLDVEFPYIYRAARAGERAIAMRYSEDESIDTVMNYSGMVDWVWIDTNTRLPLDAETVKELRSFNTCLVCPERWGRPEDIPQYRAMLNELGAELDAVMTSLAEAVLWHP